jgi:hypothetical protein
MTTFLFRRGKGAKRRVVHIAEYDRTGNPTMQPLCGRDNGIAFDTTSNVPWAQPLCRRCRHALYP